MKAILTRCGYSCDPCLAYRPNVESHPENWQKLSDGWFKYFGFRMPPGQIVCDGCLPEEPDATLLDLDCPVRLCGLERGLDNCSQCEDYSCDRLRQRLVVYEEVRDCVDAEIPEDDYLWLIRPLREQAAARRIAGLSQ